MVYNDESLSVGDVSWDGTDDILIGATGADAPGVPEDKSSSGESYLIYGGSLSGSLDLGSGSADVMPAYFEETVNDDEIINLQKNYPMIRSKEELYYFKIFTKYFGNKRAVETVGQWVSL